MDFQFKRNYTEEVRKTESCRILTKYPDRIPVIAEVQGDRLPPLEKKKYLVPAELTVGQFMFVLRKRIVLQPDQAIFLFCDSKVPPATMMMSQLYAESCEPDGFLYLAVTGENTFGHS